MMVHKTKLFIASMMITLLAVAPAMAQKHHHKCKHHCDRPKKVKYCGPPSWAPAHGHRAQVNQHRHIYYPEHDVYYDTQKEVYIYVDRGGWRVSARLPLPLRRMHIESSTQVVLDTQTEWPQRYNETHRRQYRPTRTASYGRRTYYRNY
ncbi:hypothetical protein [Reichenbachiella ulvae]|uniref:YXWGXW repeat-containing protein n=1 Tax=Reichenbachiella ulvae TaxID=2980104 RepID=A0ABT3CZT0_9BACT|nr:hypothetical protein [Reichenbachiella ulvae]MCV9389201.1 hypothetical protein [Reichenbachiella ulvae]